MPEGFVADSMAALVAVYANVCMNAPKAAVLLAFKTLKFIVVALE